MQISRAVIKGEWVTCWCCGHKLGRVIGDPSGMEIKCSSCNTLNVVEKKDVLEGDKKNGV